MELAYEPSSSLSLLGIHNLRIFLEFSDLVIKVFFKHRRTPNITVDPSSDDVEMSKKLPEDPKFLQARLPRPYFFFSFPSFFPPSPFLLGINISSSVPVATLFFSFFSILDYAPCDV